jgi:hypothetical protein
MSRLCDTYKTPITKCTACMNANAVSRGLLSVVSLPVSLPSGGPATAPAPPSKQQGWRARRASHLWHPVISRPAQAALLAVGCTPYDEQIYCKSASGPPSGPGVCTVKVSESRCCMH